MSFFSADLSPFLFKIWDATAGELKHLRRPKPQIEELEKAMAKLRAKEDDIDIIISLAKLEGEIPGKQVELWLEQVKDLKGKAAATEQDFESWRCLGDWSWNCYSVNRRVAKRMANIDNLMARLDITPISMKPPPPAVLEIISDSSFGMEAYKSEILGYITGPNAIEVIGIYGMGGVGKTTLLKSINNHRDIATKFDHVIWAVASTECKMERLQEDIAKWLGLHLKQDDSTDDCAVKLYDFLKNKDCLLLLDDLWEQLNLAMLGMVNASSGHGEQKRKVVVFTTRDKKVCDSMKARRHIQIKCLEPEEAWLLFKSKASDVIGSDPGIEHIARQIAKECAGHPIALITVGMALSRKKWEAWNNALTLMKQSQIPQVTGKKGQDLMFYVFKLSYDMLQDDEIKGCLLSCALWPKDHSIKTEELIECWMGLCLINEGQIHRTYDKGYSHIETLKAACLLEPGNDKEREVKMHDLIRVMALWLASDCDNKKFKWIVRAGVEASQAIEKEAWHEAERASLMNNNIASLRILPSPCPKLSVLLLRCNNKLDEIHGSLIEAISALTYLDLEHTGIREIPKEIGKLVQLQHLNLSSTPITGLPAELGGLVNLKYLLLRDTSNFTIVPEGAISGLSSLRLLDLRGSGYKDCWDELKNFKGCKKSIGIDIKTEAAFRRLCSLSCVLIWRLNVKTLRDSSNLNQLLDDIIKSCNTWQSMEQLRIEDVEMNESLISEENNLECMKYLELCRLNLLEEIKWNGVQPEKVFPYLRELIISRCERLRDVNWALQLPSLIVLDISFCDAMEELISDKVTEEFKSEKITEELISDEGKSTLPNFAPKRITLSQMPKLKRISATPLRFPCCEEITVLSCPLLTKLSFEKDSVKRLKVIRCEQAWWDNLQEDAAIKGELSRIVKD